MENNNNSSVISSSSEEEAFERHSEECGSSNLSADISGGDGSSSCGSLSLSCSRGETPSYHGEARGECVASSSNGSSPLGWPIQRSATCNSRLSRVPLSSTGGRDTVIWEDRKEKKLETDLSEIDMMKERFAKLLLGEDMSGGGKGVCSALAISNAITNLSASVFGELWRLEPLASQKKAMWNREMQWLLSVSDSIVELIPTWQELPQGGSLEVMVSRPRSDLYINLPALKKLDAMLLETLDSFSDTEFWYVDRGILLGDVNDDGYVPVRPPSQRQEDKWWLPTPKVPTNGLSSGARKQLQHHRECTNQILKAAMAINNQILSEMEIPYSYLESLPKNGKDSLGDIIYRYITAEQFSPDCLLDCLDLSSEHHTLDIANRVETAMHIWKQKLHSKHTHGKASKPNSKSSWGKMKDFVGDAERRELLAGRAESILLALKQRFPGLPQTILDMNKIQYNKDVGQSILESYSRVLESLAFNIIARIDDLIFVDDMAKKVAAQQHSSILAGSGRGAIPANKKVSTPFSLHLTSSPPYSTPFATPTPQSSPGRGPISPFNGRRASDVQDYFSHSRRLHQFPGGEKKVGDTNPNSNDLVRIRKSVLAELGRAWSYNENQGSRRYLTTPRSP